MKIKSNTQGFIFATLAALFNGGMVTLFQTKKIKDSMLK